MTGQREFTFDGIAVVRACLGGFSALTVLLCIEPLSWSLGEELRDQEGQEAAEQQREKVLKRNHFDDDFEEGEDGEKVVSMKPAILIAGVDLRGSDKEEKRENEGEGERKIYAFA